MIQWPKLKVRDIATFLKGKKPAVTYDSPVPGSQPYILIENFNGAYRLFTDDSNCIPCHPEDTLIVADGANCGLVTSGLKGFMGSTIGALRPDTKKIHPRYLFFYIHSLFDILNTRVRGAAVPHLEKELMLDLEMMLPPLPEQEQIVRILDEVDQLRRLRDEADLSTSNLTPAIFHEMFPLGSNTSQSLVEATIEQLAEQRDGSIRTGPFGSDLLHSEFTTKGVPVLGIDNVVANEFRWTEPRCIPESKYEAFKRFRVFPGDVMVTIMGTVGRCAVAPEDLPVCISTKHLCVVSLDRSRVIPQYLWASILFDESVRQQTKIIGSGAIMEGWNSTIIRSLRIRVPSLEKQRIFVAHVAEVQSLKKEQACNRHKLNDLFQSLLQRAFQGEL